MSDTPNLSTLIPTFKVGSVEYNNKLDSDLYINRNDLSNSFAEHSHKFAFYCTAYELAAAQVNLLETNLDRIYAILDSAKRQELDSMGVKATEKKIENMVITDDRYMAVKNELLEAQAQAGVLKAAMQSMIHRKDMLVQLGSAAKAEMAADISMKANAVKR